MSVVASVGTFLGVAKSIAGVVKAGVDAYTKAREPYQSAEFIGGWDLTEIFRREIAPDIASIGSAKIIAPRKWLIDKIKIWREKAPDHQAMVIIGPPGAGKSAFTHNIVFNDSDKAVIGYHFFRTNISQSTDPMKFVRSLSMTLAQRLPEYDRHSLWKSFRGQLQTYSEGEGGEGAIAYFHKVILEPLTDILADRTATPVMIVLDGLDEIVDGDQRKAIVTIIKRLIERGPPHLRVLITQRPLDEDGHGPHRHEFTGLKRAPLTIDLAKTSDKDWLADMRDFVKGWLGNSGIKKTSPLYKAIKANVDKIAEASGRSLLLACLLLRHLEEQPWDSDLSTFDFASQPNSLPTAYKSIFDKTFGSGDGAVKDYRQRSAPPLQTLAVARDSQPEDLVPRDERDATSEGGCLHSLSRERRLHGFIQVDEQPIPAPIGEDGTRAFRFFHKSLPDWLLHKNRHCYFQFGEEEAHGTMADQCWRIFLRLKRAVPELKKDLARKAIKPHPAYSFVMKHGVFHVLEAKTGIQRAIEMVDFSTHHLKLATFIATSVPKYECDIEAKTRELLAGFNELEDGFEADIDTSMLARLLKDFYETAPLVPGIKALYRRQDTWESSRKILLDANNYVIRFNIGEVIADTVTATEDQGERKHLLVTLASELDHPDVNRFEVAAYALRHIGGSFPRLIEPEILEQMLLRDIYVGCSTLGDLCVNLALMGKRPLQLPDIAAFKAPVWPHIIQDVADIAAITAYRGSQEIDCPDYIKDQARLESGQLQAIAAERHALIDAGALEEGVLGLLRDESYYALGNEGEKIFNALPQLEALAPDQLYKVMRCLMAHPLWDVGEAAATALASIVARNRSAMERVIIHLLGFKDDAETRDPDSLSEDKPLWRIRFGAVEAAYIFADYDGGRLFSLAVAHYFDHPASRIRALCAEDLVDIVLAPSNDDIEGMLQFYHAPILHWIKDEDCWVVEHIYKLFQTLDDRGDDLCDTCLDLMEEAKKAPLLAGLPMPWAKLSREEFLSHIEAIKWTEAGRSRL